METIYYWKDTITECFEGEIWKNIEGFNELYQVSTFGRLKSIRNNIIMKQRNRGGYRCSKISLKGLAAHKSTHIYLAESFIENPENKSQVNHKDGDKENNHISNLEWNTPSENAIHAYENGLSFSKKGEDCYISKFTNKEVEYIYTNPENLTMIQLAEKFNRDKRIIHSIWERKCWKSITENLILNKVLEKGISKKGVEFIFSNPFNLLSWELSEIFDCTLCNINSVQSQNTYKNLTYNLKLNRETGSKSSKFYKYFYKNEIYYVSSIMKFHRNICKGKIGRTSLDELANKKENNIKGWSCVEISEKEYIDYLKTLYKLYIQSETNEEGA